MPPLHCLSFHPALARLLVAVALPLYPLTHAADVSDSDTALIRRVADGILQQTTRRLIDRSTGTTFTESKDLVAKPEISIESKFNAWFYQTWLLTDGMRRIATALQAPEYANYGEQNLEFIYSHLDYFKRQNDAHMKAAPVGDGSLSPIGFYFRINSLWQTGLAPLVLERYAETSDAKYEPYLKSVQEFLRKNPRFEDGTWYRPGKGMMTDDPYMTIPFLVREWKRTGDDRHLADAVQQLMGTHKRLMDEKNGLLRHLWDLKKQEPAGEFWGRGNGWMVLAHVELLSALPPAHPSRPEVLEAFIRHISGLQRCQNERGGWHQVLNDSSTWIETSCTGMIVYGIARGVNESWIDPGFAPAAQKGWRALREKITPEGDIVDVCGSTDTGDLEYYKKRPRLRGDLHGFGSFLLAGAEIMRLHH